MPISDMRPNAARMWDYIMGGTHNFSVDRAAVEVVRKAYPLYDDGLREQRWFLQRAMTYMAKEKGLDKFLDFGSGLPTEGNVHEVVQAINPSARVIYSDKDTIAVAFGQDILGDTPNVQYVHCDVTDVNPLLTSPVITELFGGDRRVGIGLVGVAPFVPDEPLRQFFSTMYEWAAPGSHIAVTSAREHLTMIEGMGEASEKVEIRLFARNEQETLDVLGPWNLTEPGLVLGVSWGLPEDSPEINRELEKYSICFVAYK